MANTKKPKGKKQKENPVQKGDKKQVALIPNKKNKYDITVKAPEGMTFEELLKMAVTTPLPKKK